MDGELTVCIINFYLTSLRTRFLTGPGPSAEGRTALVTHGHTQTRGGKSSNVAAVVGFHFLNMTYRDDPVSSFVHVALTIKQR